MSEKTREKLWFLFITFLLMLCFSWIQQCEEDNKPAEFLKNLSVYKTIYKRCIAGQEFYMIIEPFSSAMTHHLDEKGIPVTCEEDSIAIEMNPLEILLNGIDEVNISEEPLRENPDEVPEVR